jgi:hypothetical protein
VSTNVIPAVATAKGIQCLMAVEDLSAKSMYLSPPSTNMYVRKYNFICCIANATVVYDAIRFITEHDRSKHESNNYQKEEAVVLQRMTNTVF